MIAIPQVQVSILIVLISCSFSPAFASSQLFGAVNVLSKLQLVSVNTATGTAKSIGNGASFEAESQGLSCAMQKQGILYVLGYNETSKAANLIGFDVKDGTVSVNVVVPFAESAFVGIGQQMACDTVTNQVIVVGHDINTNNNNNNNNNNNTSTVNALTHHVMSFDPETLKFTSIVQIPSSHIGLMGSTSTLDTKRSILYTSFAYNITGKITIEFYAISIQSGKYEIVPTNPSLGHEFGPMKYDATMDSIVGFSSNPTTHVRNVATMRGDKLGTKRQWSTIGDVVGFQMEDGPIIAVDGTKKVLYAIIQPTPTGAQVYVNDTGCGCATKNFCCKDPTQPQDDGSCYTAPCNEIPTGSGGVNTTEPFRLVALDLADGAKVKGSPPLCTLAGNDCPWQLDVF